MRYFLMILAAGLLSAGLLAGSGPAHAIPTLALDRSAAITAMAITMATTGPTMGTATAGTMVTIMVMGVAGATERQEHRSKFAGKSKPVGRIPPPDQPAEEPGSRPPRVAGFLPCLQSPSSEPTNLMGYAETDVRWALSGHANRSDECLL